MSVFAYDHLCNGLHYMENFGKHRIHRIEGLTSCWHPVCCTPPFHSGRLKFFEKTKTTPNFSYVKL